MPFAFEKLHVYQKAIAFADNVCTENLKLAPEERLLKLQDFVKFLSEIRSAGRKAGLGR